MASTKKPHEIVNFMRQVTMEIQSEYERISSRSSEDPGTAGDEGEENWAALLREWLPSNYHVVTKGRILSRANIASPQVDVLVLKPEYPEKLLNKKYYLAVGVIAAFECKTNLRSDGLKKTMENAAKISKLLKEDNKANFYLDRRRDPNTAYMELHRPLIYGLLAHSHSFGCEDEVARDKISRRIKEIDLSIYQHPSELIDIVCVADLAVWRTQRAPYSLLNLKEPDQHGNPITPTLVNKPSTCYTCHHKGVWHHESSYYESTTTIGSLVTALYKKISYKDANLDEWSRYFSDACAMGVGGGEWRVWGDVLSPEAKSFYDLSDPYNSNWGLDIFG